MLKFYLIAKDRFDSAMKKLVRKEEGATMVEYALMVALIAAACIAAVTALGGSVKAMFEYLAGKITPPA